jgi:hypothetical protein
LESIKEASGLDPVRRLDDAIIARILINILGSLLQKDESCLVATNSPQGE